MLEQPQLNATSAYLNAMCAGQGLPFCLPPSLQAFRVLLARALFPAAQAEAVDWWAFDQGNAGVRTRVHSGRAPRRPFGVRLYWDGVWVEFLRVSREGSGWIPSLPDRIRYRRWRFIDGNPQSDCYCYLPPEQDSLEHAWDRLLPGWRETTVALPPSDVVPGAS